MELLIFGFIQRKLIKLIIRLRTTLAHRGVIYNFSFWILSYDDDGREKRLPSAKCWVY